MKNKLKLINQLSKKDSWMAYYQQEVISKVKQIDLFTYLKNNNPEELNCCGKNTYETKTHDSLKISNGMWYWFSQGIGGKSALDYLILVEGESFLSAMDILTNSSSSKSNYVEPLIKKEPVKFIMPVKNEDDNIAKSYLINRGIDESIIQECIDRDLIFQEKDTNNVVFIGLNDTNEAAYAALRGCTQLRYFKEARGSDKTFSFRLEGKSDELHLFESAIDVLSYATILKLNNKSWNEYNLLSLAGIYKPASDINYSKVPKSLDLFLEKNKIVKIYLHLDNDIAGRLSTLAIKKQLETKYEIIDSPSTIGKDVNDFLLSIKKNKIKKERER